MGAVLELANVESSYGPVQALRGVSLTVPEGKIVTVLGANGAGKTTTLKTISGIIAPRKGQVKFRGEEIQGRAPDRIVRAGLVQVPEGREVFPLLSVEDNLRMGGYTRRDADGVAQDLAMVFGYFPILRERARQEAGQLSGGQQQMLAIARALCLEPAVLLLDEPTEGLAPVIVERLVALLQELKAGGLPMLLVEQSLEVCRAVADRHTVIDEGRIVWSGDTAALNAAKEVVRRHLTLEEA